MTHAVITLRCPRTAKRAGPSGAYIEPVWCWLSNRIRRRSAEHTTEPAIAALSPGAAQLLTRAHRLLSSTAGIVPLRLAI